MVIIKLVLKRWLLFVACGMTPTMICLKRSIPLLFFVASSIAFAPTAFAQIQPRLFIPGALRAAVRPECPNQGGLLDSVSVPVGQSLNLSVVISSPAPPGGAVFQLSSDNPAYVAAGDKTQGFLPIVTIPSGQTQSNQFTIWGMSVGQTKLRITPLTPGFGAGAFPLGAWDVNKSGAGDAEKFVDANDPSKPCRDAGSSSLTSTPGVQANCGNTVQGVASDGLNALLLRTLSGLPGTSCFEIVSMSSLDPGAIQTPLITTQSVSGLNYGFSYYTPPSYYGDSSDSRTVTVEFTFTPNIGNGNTSRLRASTTIVRPPVMLIHGVWSNGNGWNSDYLRKDKGKTYTTFPGDYNRTNGSSFSVNQPQVKNFINQALTRFRQKGYAGTQADVIAHSMGGLLTRLYADSSDFKRPDNLNSGDVHRLITLDTPHFGSNFANLLVALHRAKPAKTESTVLDITNGGIIVNGAVCDLAENSPALQGLSGGTSLKAQVITATGGPAGTPASPAKYWGDATIFGIKSFERALTEQYGTSWTVDAEGNPYCLSYEYYFPQATVDGFRFREMNDAVVPLPSQQGGLGGVDGGNLLHFALHDSIPDWVPGIHRGVTDNGPVAAQAFQLLDGPDSNLADALPAVPSDGIGDPKTVPGRGAPLDQQDYASQCSSGGSMKPAKANAILVRTAGAAQSLSTGAKSAVAADPRVNLISPAAGAIFAPGDKINITVELTPPLTAANTVGAGLMGLTHVFAAWTTGLRFSVTFTLPPGFTGPLTITPDFTDTSGNYFTGTPVVVSIKPASPPDSIALQRHDFLLAPGASSQQLYLNGTYADGSVLDITSSLTGTTYTTTDSSVVTVSSDGLVQIIGPGFAVITAKNGSLSDFTTVVVEDPTNPLPPADFTSQVTMRSLRSVSGASGLSEVPGFSDAVVGDSTHGINLWPAGRGTARL